MMMTSLLTNLRKRKEMNLSYRWNLETTLLVLSTTTLLKAQLEISLTKALQVRLSTLMLPTLAKSLPKVYQTGRIFRSSFTQDIEAYI